MPVALPANQIGKAGDDRLIGNQVLHQHRRRADHQQNQRHPEQLRPRVVQHRVRRAARHHRHHAADEYRYRRVEQRHHQASRKQRRHQAAGLTRMMPIERAEEARRRRAENGGGAVGVSKFSETAEQVHGLSFYREPLKKTKMVLASPGLRMPNL